jgi:AcrR family transcriptional regulator
VPRGGKIRDPRCCRTVTDSYEDLRQWRLPRGRHGLPRELVERSQRERLLAAVVRVTVAKGYESTTVGDILGEAGVGRESFYELFDDKLDCMLAAHKILADDLEERVRDAYLDEGPWPERARRSLATILDWFAADPGAARFFLVELSTVGPAFRATFKAEYSRFTELLDEGLGEDGPDPELSRATQLAVGAIMARIYEEVVLGRAAELPRLLPDLTYGFLVPFVGEEAARREQELARAA